MSQGSNPELRIVDATFVAAAEDVRDLPAPVFAEVAFAGKSNGGKSSLINALVARRGLARTSRTPGRTRTLVLLRLQLPQGSLDLVDLPGYGYARVSKAERASWGPMIESFLESRAGLRVVVVIVDVRRGVEDDDAQLLEFLADRGIPAMLVATKLDKLSRSKVEPALRALRTKAGTKVLGFSAETGQGRPELLRSLLQHAALLAPRAAAAP
jgi:GTP-binding protein